MTTLEELGLLKMDFLGLRTLTVIQNAVLLARRKQPELNINQIDYNDQKVLDYIGTGKTDGVFQLESAGMKGFMKELKPHNLEVRWISFRSISEERMTVLLSHMIAHNWSRSLPLLMDVLSIRSRLCRLYEILHDTHLDEATFCVVRCQRKRRQSWRKNVRSLFMAMRRQDV